MTAAPTPSQTIGPFFRFALDWMASGLLVAAGSPDALTIRGRVVDGAGTPVPDAVVEVYQCQPADDPPPGWRGFARACTDPSGGYRLSTLKPGRPDARQAPHLDVSIFARGLLQRLWTRCYFPDEGAANASDPVLRLIADPERIATVMGRLDPEGLRFDISLQGDHETVFFDW